MPSKLERVFEEEVLAPQDKEEGPKVVEKDKEEESVEQDDVDDEDEFSTAPSSVESIKRVEEGELLMRQPPPIVYLTDLSAGPKPDQLQKPPQQHQLGHGASSKEVERNDDGKKRRSLRGNLSKELSQEDEEVEEKEEDEEKGKKKKKKDASLKPKTTLFDLFYEDDF